MPLLFYVDAESKHNFFELFGRKFHKILLNFCSEPGKTFFCGRSINQKNCFIGKHFHWH